MNNRVGKIFSNLSLFLVGAASLTFIHARNVRADIPPYVDPGRFGNHPYSAPVYGPSVPRPRTEAQQREAQQREALQALGQAVQSVNREYRQQTGQPLPVNDVGLNYMFEAIGIPPSTSNAEALLRAMYGYANFEATCFSGSQQRDLITRMDQVTYGFTC